MHKLTETQDGDTVVPAGSNGILFHADGVEILIAKTDDEDQELTQEAFLATAIGAALIKNQDLFKPIIEWFEKDFDEVIKEAVGDDET